MAQGTNRGDAPCAALFGIHEAALSTQRAKRGPPQATFATRDTAREARPAAGVFPDPTCKNRKKQPKINLRPPVWSTFRRRNALKVYQCAQNAPLFLFLELQPPTPSLQALNGTRDTRYKICWFNGPVEKRLDLTAVGFEPTRFAPPELESGALDHSATLSDFRPRVVRYFGSLRGNSVPRASRHTGDHCSRGARMFKTWIRKIYSQQGLNL